MPRLKIWDSSTSLWDYVDNQYSSNPMLIISASYVPNKRELISADRTYYVNPTGSNSNDGLTTATPFQTVQYALNYAATNIDPGIFLLTVQMTDGTYAENIIVPRCLTSGTASLVLNGNQTNPSLTVISASNTSNAVSVIHYNGSAILSNFKIDGGFNSIYVNNGSVVSINNLIFGKCAPTAWHMNIFNGSEITVDGPYAVSGSTFTTAGHVISYVNSRFICGIKRVSITGSWTVTSQFAWADTLGSMYAIGNTYVSTSIITGARYSATANGTIVTLGGANYFPGNSAGGTATGGQYV